MSINRRRLLGGSLAAAAAAGPLGAMTSMAHGAEQVAAAEGFDVVLLDAKKGAIDTYNTGDWQVGSGDDKGVRFRNRKSQFLTGGWSPLECRFREINGELLFMVCGADRDNPSELGRVTIHRQRDGAPYGADATSRIFPHSIEYLPTANAVVVVGTAGNEDFKDGLPAGHDLRLGGSYQLYTAPSPVPGSFRAIGSPQPLREGHGVVWDPDPAGERLWMFGGNKLKAFVVSGQGEATRLEEDESLRLTDGILENGHDLQPDYLEPEYLWATGSKYMFKIRKRGAGGKPEIEWRHRMSGVKSFSRHPSGLGLWTTSRGEDNVYGGDEVHFIWNTPEQPGVIMHPDRTSWIYKARTTEHRYVSYGTS